MTVASRLEFKRAEKISITLFFLFLLACGGKSDQKKEDFVPTLETIDYQKNYFKEAEHFEYTVKYGFMRGGYVNITVDTLVHQLNNKPSYKIQIVGEASGLADKLNDFRDVFVSYVDTSTYLPVAFIRDLKENKYVKKDITFFDRDALLATCTEKNTQNPDSVKTTKISYNTQDIISAYFLLRNLDLKHKKIDDTLTIDLFFDNQAHNLKMRIVKKDIIRTKIGERKCLIISPIIPDNPFLRSETPILAWISDDEDRIPLRVKAKLFAGAFDVSILKYEKKKN